MEIIDREVNFIPGFDISDVSKPDSTLFIDIESTGLSKEFSQLYLIGCAFLRDDNWIVRQYFAENSADEREILEVFSDFAKKFKTLVHFNGDRFDIPYLAYKAADYGIDINFNEFNGIDIYKRSRRLRKFLGLHSMSQKTIEEFLGIFRDDMLNGGLLIRVYYEYEKTGAPDLRKLLLLHNFDDMQGMLKILPIMNYIGILEGACTFKNFEIHDDTAIIEFELDYEVPVPVTYKFPSCRKNFFGEPDEADTEICVCDNLLQVNVRVYKGEGKYPLPNYKDYYYLPEEDKVIHKDVARFVGRAYKVKATKANCCVKRQSEFLPQYRNIFLPAFNVEGDKKRTYFETTQIPDMKPDMWKAYLTSVISKL